MNSFISEKQLRREADFRRLKSRHPICLVCGYDREPAALQYAHVSPSQFGVGDGGTACMNCHCEMTEQERPLGFTPEAEDRELEQAGRYVFALGEWLERIGKTLKHFGSVLLQRASSTMQMSDQTEGAE